MFVGSAVIWKLDWTEGVTLKWLSHRLLAQVVSHPMGLFPGLLAVSSLMTAGFL